MSYRATILGLATVALGSQVWAQQVGPLPDIQHGTIAVELTAVATGLGAPDYAISPPGDLNRLFVLEQKGTILIIQNGALLPTPALDIQSRVSPPLNPANANDERGLLGLAFHPGFDDPTSVGLNTLYTYTTEPIPVGSLVDYPAPNNAVQNYKLVVTEWKMSANPNIIDPASRRELLSIGKNAGNHNGGTLAFGPDGYMYLAVGDGGNANDVGPSHIEPGGNAQNLTTPLGKMLRFDPIHPSLTPTSLDAPSANGQYRIPQSNPYDGAGEVPEMFAIGLRNPYRFAFDTANGELILADVGQNNIEEIDRIEIGQNYGWAVKEGTFLFDRATGTIGADSPGVPAGLVDPLSGPNGRLEYDHSDGISITGGFMYRGTDIPQLFGKYVFGDLAIRNNPPRVDGRLFWADLATGDMFEFLLPQFPNDQLPNGLTVHGFGQDGHGELYAVVTNTPANGTGGIVYKFGPAKVVATTLESFECAAVDDGIRLRWRFHEPVDVSAVRVERAESRHGPWMEIAAERRTEGGQEEALDRSVVAGTQYFYRLTAMDDSGRRIAFAPIEVTAGELLPSLAIARITPNPSRGPINIEFALPRDASASVRLIDPRGRVVAEVANGMRAAGRHRVAWNGLTDRGLLAAGVYFVELRANGIVRSERVVVMH